MDHVICTPGWAAEHELQGEQATEWRARQFYADRMLDHLNPRMRSFVSRPEMLFIATSDARGECDASFRAGPPGFMQVLDNRALA